MTVQELIERLEDFDPEAEVRLMTQQQWPFENAVHGMRQPLAQQQWPVENAVHGVCSGEQLAPDGPDEEPDPAAGLSDPPAPVFIVEGAQLRYGSKSAWEVCI